MSWRDLAACVGVDSDVFFPSAPLGRPSEPDGYMQARLICGSCPVSAECLQDAVRHKSQVGMFGGWTPQERKRGRRQPPSPQRKQGTTKKKHCPSCGYMKPVTLFARRAKSLDGRQSWCLQCKTAAQRQRRSA